MKVMNYKEAQTHLRNSKNADIYKSLDTELEMEQELAFKNPSHLINKRYDQSPDIFVPKRNPAKNFKTGNDVRH